MRGALDIALSLTQARDEASLTRWLLTALQLHWRPQGVLLGMVDVSGRYLECQGWMGKSAVSLTLETNDFSHPLAHVLLKDNVCVWDTLYGGARIEHQRFRRLLNDVGSQCGLYALPVKEDEDRPWGIVALFDSGEALRQWQEKDDVSLLTQVFVRQLRLLRALGDSQRECSALKTSLRTIAGENEQRRRQEKVLEEKMIGQSTAIRQLYRQVSQAAAHRLSVLIQGETGSGKDVVARLLHQCSSREAQPFVAINCAAIPENLIESELFGYRKGAFSGAQSDKTGLVAQANGGTLFLDEVGDMPLTMQAKLLRVLETRSFRPLGGEKERHSDFRLIAATHQPLEQLVNEGRFRQDLYHRLCQCLLLVPPLRERPDDIGLLCEHFISHFARQEGKQFGGLTRTFLKQLLGYDFPGNVRELRNLLEVACAQTPDGQPVGLDALPPELRERLSGSPMLSADDYNHICDLRLAIQQYEAAVIAAKMRYFQGNRERVAESLNIPRRTLNHKCQKLEVG
ncbi:AAA family ATPase [Brenneria alni]|uniref:AAA family ATPase n=1 Tax=Brenneria alni TaxID=71656 RepID=A0A421DM61_9GAMM|nr:sigma-54 dependent transcriptional regulator [Brenneria alni]RLM21872.1 AAA family ATPase [Brenneria alni]